MFTEHLEDEIYQLRAEKVALESNILNYRNWLMNLEFHESMGGNVFREMLLKHFDKNMNIVINKQGKI